jgi:hypothetical protein
MQSILIMKNMAIAGVLLLRQVFSFIGGEDVNIIGADRMNVDADASFAGAKLQIEELYPAITAREVA